jgi:hypothetical protein
MHPEGGRGEAKGVRERSRRRTTEAIKHHERKM